MAPFRVFLLLTFILCFTVNAQGQLKRGIGLIMDNPLYRCLTKIEGQIIT